MAGNTTENAFAALTVAAVGLIAFHKMNGKSLPLEMFFGLAGAFCGGVAMVFSPGELARLSSSGQGFEASVIFERCLDIARRYLSAYWTILAVIALLLCVGLFSKTLKRDEAVLFAVYFVSSLAGAFSLILSPASPDRAWSCVTVFAVLSLQSLLWGVLKDAKVNVVLNICTALLALSLVVSYCFVYAELISVRSDFEERDMLAQEQVAQGCGELDLPAVSSQSKYSPFEAWGDLDADPDDWKNVAMARYYGVNRVNKSH